MQYLHVRFNESLNSHDHAVNVSKIVKRVVSHFMFTLYVYAQMSASSVYEISDVKDLKRHTKDEWADSNNLSDIVRAVIECLVGDVAPMSICACVRTGEKHLHVHFNESLKSAKHECQILSVKKS